MENLINKIFKTEKAEFGTKIRGYKHLISVPSPLGGLTRYYAREHFDDNINLLIAQVHNEGKTFSKDILIQGTRIDILDPFMLEFLNVYNVNKDSEITNITESIVAISMERVIENAKWSDETKNTFKKEIPDFIKSMDKIKQIISGGFDLLYCQDNEKIGNAFHNISCVFVKKDIANGNGYIIFKPFEIMETASTVNVKNKDEKKYILNDLPFITLHESVLK